MIVSACCTGQTGVRNPILDFNRRNFGEVFPRYRHVVGVSREDNVGCILYFSYYCCSLVFGNFSRSDCTVGFINRNVLAAGSNFVFDSGIANNAFVKCRNIQCRSFTGRYCKALCFLNSVYGDIVGNAADLCLCVARSLAGYGYCGFGFGCCGLGVG